MMDKTSLWRRSLMDIFTKDEGALTVARSTDNLDVPGDQPRLQIRGKSGKRPSIVKGHFPKLAECAHFHYEYVDFRTVQLALASQPADTSQNGLTVKEPIFLIQVLCQGKGWLVRRSYEDFQSLDSHLHQCIYDRRFSLLPEIPTFNILDNNTELIHNLLTEYLSRLTTIADNKINCGPVLTWMEIDNKGNRLLVNDEAFINVPAIAAAHVIKRYTAQARDELSFEVGDIVSVIDMPPKDDTTWWRGKHGFQVGFFPSECVQLISERPTPSNITTTTKADCEVAGQKPVPANPPSPTSVSKRHGKLMGLLLNFMKSRPTRQKLKQRGILKERVFGCDLGEHLLNSGLDVPQVLRSCSEFIEEHGIVDGIYRLSGISSNIQKLRHMFDSDQTPDLERDVYMQDIHCVSSLCKLYFRELPNPLLTYQLYEHFAAAVCLQTNEERLLKVHDVIQQLPPPHYRTLQFLMRHLAKLAQQSPATNMHVKNLAIVWAPNLLRSKEIESVGFTGTDAFREVRIQSIVVEFLLRHVEILFSDTFSSAGMNNPGHSNLLRPKSTLIPSLANRLLTIEEAQARSLAQGDEGTGAVYEQLRPIHTATGRRKDVGKMRKAGGGSWKTIFAIGKVSALSRRKSQLEVFNSIETDAGSRGETVTLRSAKSEESLSSQHSGAVLPRVRSLRRHRSSSDAVSVSVLGDGLELATFPHCPSSASSSDDQEAIYMVPDFPVRTQEELVPGQRGDPRRTAHRLGSPATADRASRPVSFTRKLVRSAPSATGRTPSPDISNPVAISIPANVLQLVGSLAGEGQAAVLSPGDPAARTISLLLRSRDFQLASSSKGESENVSATSSWEVKGREVSPGPEDSLKRQHDQPPVYYQTMASLPVSGPRQLPPPPPPKNAARLMALTLMEQAHQVSRQSVQDWQEGRQQFPAPEGGTGNSVTEYQPPDQENHTSPLYSTVDPLRKGSPREHSPLDSHIEPGYSSDQLIAQESRVSLSPPILSDVYSDGNVKLTQSLRGPISHCRVGASVHPLPTTPLSSYPSHQRPSPPYLNPQSPPGTAPSSESVSPCSPWSHPPRPVMRCHSAVTLPTLPPPPPRAPPPPLQPPHASPCVPGTPPKSQSLAPRPSNSQAPGPNSGIAPSAQHPEMVAALPPASSGCPVGWGSVPDPCGRGEGDSELYAEIGSDPLQCHPVPARLGPAWLDMGVSPPFLLYWDPPKPMASVGHPVLPSDPLLPKKTPLPRACSVPQRRPPASDHPLCPCPARGRVCRGASVSDRHVAFAHTGQEHSPAPLNLCAPASLSPHADTGCQLPEPTYVNVPVHPCWGGAPANPRQQSTHGEIPNPPSRCPPSSQAAPPQPDSPLRHPPGYPPPYRGRNVPPGFPQQGVRGTEIAHPRSRSDPGDTGRGLVPEVQPGVRSQSRGSPRVLGPYAGTSGSRQKQGDHRCPTGARSRSVHPALVRALRPPVSSCTLHAGGQFTRPPSRLHPSQGSVPDPYSLSPEYEGLLRHCPTTLTLAPFPHDYQEVMVTYESGPPGLKGHPPGSCGGRRGSGKGSRDTSPYNPLPHPRVARHGLPGRHGTVLVPGRYGNLPPAAPLPLHQLCHARSHQQPEGTTHRPNRLDWAERSFC
ncbi:rho GTPase-activating protein 33-like isoform X3 [Scyliorhinus torazame]